MKVLKEEFNGTYNEGRILVELPPCRRSVVIDGRRYFLSMPTMRFVVAYILNTDKNLYYSKELQVALVINNQIFVPPLPNISGNSLAVCSRSQHAKTVLELVDKNIKDFFAAEFHGSPQNLVYEWAEKTRKDHHWIPDSYSLKAPAGSKREYATFLM